MKRISIFLFIIAAVLVLTATLPASAAPVSPVNPKNAIGTLTDQEKADLLFLREEEKLARDLYSAAYTKWNIPVFWNTARAEKTHMDALKTLITRYGLNDPVVNKAGVFTDPELQQVYDTLIEQVSTSPRAALEAAILVEQTDIEDLDRAITDTGKRDLVRVYTSLRQGSANHEKAFTSALKRY